MLMIATMKKQLKKAKAQEYPGVAVV